MVIPEQEWVMLSALNHYHFCARRCYYIHVEQTFADNVHTIQGHLNHRKAHSDQIDTREGVTTYRSLYVYSRRFGIYGFTDLVEVDSSGVMVPIEHKSGSSHVWKNDAVQLCGQALCLEEMFATDITHGFLFSHGSRRRRKIEMDRTLRDLTYRVIEDVREMLLTHKRPVAEHRPRCRGCSLHPVCLPEETTLLRQQQRESVCPGRS